MESNTFNKSERLCGELRVAQLFQHGRTVMAYPIRACWTVTAVPPEGAARVQVLMSVPKKKLRRANRRNRVKRLLRESYRLQKHELLAEAARRDLFLQIAFVWIPEEVLPYAAVSVKVKKVLDKILLSLQPHEEHPEISV